MGEDHGRTLPGYKALIEGYIASTPEVLDPKLADMSYPLEIMAAQYTVALKERDFNKQASILVQDIEDPKKSNTTYISYSNRSDSGGGHANIIKYSKEGDIYYRTIYNAGLNVAIDNKKLDKVNQDNLKKLQESNIHSANPGFVTYSAIKFPLKKEYQSVAGIKEVIMQELKDSFYCDSSAEARYFPESYNKKIEKRHKKFFDSPKPEDPKLVTKEQFMGNCSTRSIRETLRHNIDGSTFRNLYDYITTNDYSHMLERLESKMQAYESQHGQIQDNPVKPTKFKDKFKAVKSTNFLNKFTDVFRDMIWTMQSIPKLISTLFTFNNNRPQPTAPYLGSDTTIIPNFQALNPDDRARITKIFEVVKTHGGNQMTNDNKQSFIKALREVFLQDPVLSLTAKGIINAPQANSNPKDALNMIWDEIRAQEITEKNQERVKTIEIKGKKLTSEQQKEFLTGVEQPAFNKDIFKKRKPGKQKKADEMKVWLEQNSKSNKAATLVPSDTPRAPKGRNNNAITVAR